MEFDKSALIGLKAELLRKREEVENAKRTKQNFKRPKILLNTESDKSNIGVEERDRLDALESEVPGDILEKSKKMLEIKSKLYDELSSQKLDSDNTSFLVDFSCKSREEVDNKDIDSDSDSDWVDFVDCLGRTRRCLKDDLEEMKKRDNELKSVESKTISNTSASVARDNLDAECDSELVSGGMQREQLRQKWEKKEQELLGARDVHYQDVLFDEARQHGVAYYAFSTDESERKRQQEELRKLRQQTVEEKEAHHAAEKSKKKQMKERLKAAQRRKRERLGLPPEEEEHSEEEEKEISNPNESYNSKEGVERNVRKPSSVREWDIGKEDPSRILSQEEWVTKKRAERPGEFAPPFSLQTNNLEKRRNTPTATVVRKAFKSSTSFSSTSFSKEYLDDLHYKQLPLCNVIDSPIQKEEPSENTKSRKRAEIPPPSCLEDSPTITINKSSIEKSIDEGLQYLRQQAEKKSQRQRNVSDFIS